MIRNSEKLYYKNKFDNLKGNIRGTWQLINKILREITHQLHQCCVNEIFSDGITVKDPFLIASKFNEIFINSLTAVSWGSGNKFFVTMYHQPGIRLEHYIQNGAASWGPG